MKRKYFIHVLNFINGSMWLIIQETHQTGFVNHHFKFDKKDAAFLKN